MATKYFAVVLQQASHFARILARFRAKCEMAVSITAMAASETGYQKLAYIPISRPKGHPLLMLRSTIRTKVEKP